MKGVSSEQNKGALKAAWVSALSPPHRVVLGGCEPSPGPLHLRKPSWAPARGGKPSRSHVGIPNCRFSLRKGWRWPDATLPRRSRASYAMKRLPSRPGALSPSHNPVRQQQPPVLAAGPDTHPSLGRSAASPSPPVARRARTQLPWFPARSEAAGGDGTRRPARPRHGG